MYVVSGYVICFLGGTNWIFKYYIFVAFQRVNGMQFIYTEPLLGMKTHMNLM